MLAEIKATIYIYKNQILFIFTETNIFSMGKLISMSAYVINSTQQSPSLQIGIQEDDIVTVRAASTAQKQSYPAASTNINTWVVANQPSENSEQQTGYLIGENVNTIINGS